ncbi:MAG: SAM-dependent chlorinase/fluorinase [Solobacterium sp.]|nr:SAM-dependent chlorinase/fluorinase [Solobacterium sp.]
MKPAIVIQTDFSSAWCAAAEMKGVIRITDPELDVIDATHEIRPFDVWEASLSLNALEPYWPSGTVFISVVDPDVGTDRTACAARLNDGSFVFTPDNGTLTHLLHSTGIEEVRKIDETLHLFHGRNPASVFHGRDLFSCCAAKLASSKICFADIGPSYPVEQIIQCGEYFLRPSLSPGKAEGFIQSGNRHFGGICLNLTEADLTACGFQFHELLRTELFHSGTKCYDRFVPLCRTFGETEIGSPLLYPDSSGFISLDLNRDHFMKRYGIGYGKEWTARISRIV